VMNKCKDCGHWDNVNHIELVDDGTCHSNKISFDYEEKLISLGSGVCKLLSKHDGDKAMLECRDYGCTDLIFRCSNDFGCTEWESNV